MSPSRPLAMVAVGPLTATTSASGAVVGASSSSVPSQVAWVANFPMMHLPSKPAPTLRSR